MDSLFLEYFSNDKLHLNVLKETRIAGLLKLCCTLQKWQSEHKDAVGVVQILYMLNVLVFNDSGINV